MQRVRIDQCYHDIVRGQNVPGKLVVPTSRFQEYLLNAKTGKPNGFRESLRMILANFRHVAHERFCFAEWQDRSSIQIPSESPDPNRKSSNLAIN